MIRSHIETEISDRDRRADANADVCGYPCNLRTVLLTMEIRKLLVKTIFIPGVNLFTVPYAFGRLQ